MSVPDAGFLQLRKFLLSGRNPDGGWGYYPGKASRLEPTCWSLLGLGRDAQPFDVLRRWPSSGGLLLERAGGEPNFGFHGVALLALRGLGLEHEAGNAALISAIEQVKGLALDTSSIQRQDNTLQAWSWIPKTFSWVEPTAWCLLALKKWSRVPGVTIDRSRCEVAERMLIDRCCAAGGWNYGNSNMLGQQLKPFVPTTALALLAMQDRAAEPAVQRSRDYLERDASSELSGVALSLALMCLTTYRRPAGNVRAVLEQQIPTTLALGSQVSAALTLCALQPGVGDAAVAISF
jgi:hypothetical protein